VVLGDCWQLNDLPLVCPGVIPCQGNEFARKVLSVPAGHDDKDAGILLLAGVEGRGVPVPDVLADGGGVGLLAVLDGIVDDEPVCAHAGDATSDTRAAVAPLVPDDLEDIGVAQVRPGHGAGVGIVEACVRKQLLVGLGVDDALDIPVKAAGQIGGVTGGDDGSVGEIAQDPGG